MATCETVRFVLWGGPKDGVQVDVPQRTRPVLRFNSEGYDPVVRHLYVWSENPARKEPRIEYTYRGWEL